MSIRASLIILIILGILLLAIPASARPLYAYISFQGKLTTPAGTPVPDGSYDMTFRFYDAYTAGNLLLTDQHTSADGNAVSVSSGLYSAMLGGGTVSAGTEPSLFDTFKNHPEVYLGVSVGTDPEMTPRMLMCRAPYAFNAQALGGKAATDFLDTSATEQTKAGKLNIAASLPSQILNVTNNSTTTGIGIAAQANSSSGTAIYGVNSTGTAIKGYSNAVTDADFGSFYNSGGAFGGKNGVIGVTNLANGAGVIGAARVSGSVAGYFESDASGTHAGEFSGFVGIFGTPLNTAKELLYVGNYYSGWGAHIIAASPGTPGAAVLAENTNASGIGLYSLVTSSDTSLLAVNKGTGQIIKGFSGATGGNLVFQVDNNGNTLMGGDAAANSYLLNATATSKLTLPPAAFTTSDTGSYQLGNVLVNNSATSIMYFYAPVALPQGAVITKLFGFFDDTDLATATIYLIRHSLTNPSIIYYIAQANSINDTARTEGSANTSLNVVDNDTWAYSVGLRLPGATAPNRLRFAGGQVVYTYAAIRN